VTAFALFRTRSPEAAMRVETMGPAFAVVAATGPGATPDPVSGLDLYTGTWSGAFDPSWDDWYVRAVAQPVDTVPVEAVRGLPSAASDQVLLRVRPTTPPDLAPLASQVWGGGHDGVLVTTSTSAPARDLPDGVFRLSASVSAAQASGGPADVAPVALGSVPVGPVDLGGGAPAGASSDVLLRSGGRAAGRMPLAVWFTRPVAGSPVDVTVRLVDPLGGESVQTLSVPGWVAATPPSLVVLGVTKVVGRVVLRVASDAPVDAGRPVTMTIVVTPRGRVIGPVVLPVDRGFAGLLAEPLLGGGAAAGGRAATEAVVGRAAAGGKASPAAKASAKATEAAAARIPIEHLDPGQVLVPVGRQTLTTRLDQIPTVAKPSTASIQVVRAAHTTPQEYDVLIRVATPFTVAVALDAADGGHAQVAQAVP
jgi:hypothetical protein